MRIKTGLGLLIVVILAAGLGFCGKNYVDSAKKEFAEQEASLPESGISSYFARIREKDYDGIYDDSMIVAPHINSKEDYIAKLQSIYDGVDTARIQYTGLDNTDGSKDYKLYYDNRFLATLKLIKAPDTVEVVGRVRDGQKWLFVLNYLPEAQEIKLNEKMVSLLDEETAEGRVEIPPYGVAVYRI